MSKLNYIGAKLGEKYEIGKLYVISLVCFYKNKVLMEFV